MPRASYNDKHTISIIQGTLESGKHHVLDFTSKVIDFLVIDSRNNIKGIKSLVFLKTNFQLLRFRQSVNSCGFGR